VVVDGDFDAALKVEARGLALAGNFFWRGGFLPPELFFAAASSRNFMRGALESF